MSSDTARRYFIVFIDTLAKLLQYFPRFAVYVKDIRNMLRSIDEPNAPLPAQKASTEVDFRARPVPSEENSDEDNATSQTHVATAAGGESTDQLMPRNVSPKDLEAQTVIDIDESWFGSLPLEGEYDLGSYFESPEYSMNLRPGSDQGMLWDWADALGSGFSLWCRSMDADVSSTRS